MCDRVEPRQLLDPGPDLQRVDDLAARLHRVDSARRRGLWRRHCRVEARPRGEAARLKPSTLRAPRRLRWPTPSAAIQSSVVLVAALLESEAHFLSINSRWAETSMRTAVGN